MLNYHLKKDFKQFFLILTLVFLFFNLKSNAQTIVDNLNSLPSTQIEKAPVFDIEKKYFFSLDSINMLLIIQEIHRKPDSKELHFDQMIYEIPLNDLSIGSYRVVKKDNNKSLLKFKIGTVRNKSSIIRYWLRDNNVVLIESLGILTMGAWDYSEKLEKELSNIVKSIISVTPNKSYETNIFIKSGIKNYWKYKAESVTMFGGDVINKVLNDGYYYNSSIKNPALYSNTKSLNRSNLKLINEIKQELKKNNIVEFGRTPVLIQVDKVGNIESIFIANLSNDQNKAFDISNFSSFSPGNDGEENLKARIILVIQ